MLNRNALMLVAGAAIFALDASATSAQVKPTSTKRIPVTKEAPGEVAPRVDSVMIYRTDTLRLPGRVDTVTTTNTITRVDTVSIPMPQVLRQIGGFYFGLGGGSSLPAANFNDSDHPGWRIEGLMGIDPLGSPFGVRLTGAYNRYEPHSYVENFLGNAQIWTAGLDAKLRLVKIQPFEKRVQLYGIAGGTWNRYKDVLENHKGVLSVGDNIGGQQLLPAVIDHDWHSGWGYNLGGGAELGWGRTNLFIESRFSRFSGEFTKISSIPLVIGLSWF